MSRLHVGRAGWVCALLVSVGIVGCDATGGASTGPPKEGKYRIVTTCGMVTDIVRAVAGERAEVVGLMGEGVDPHLYKPTSNDVKQLEQADVVFYVGLGLEGRMADTFTQLARNGRKIYAVTEKLDPQSLREPPEFEGHYDPHIWMDVAAWSQCVEFIAHTLAEYDASHADSYTKNAETYRAELAKLDAYAREVIATIPEPQRVLVTAHDAFGYFSRAYTIPVKSVQGITTESEAAVSDINELVDFIAERKLPAIFIESSVSEKNIQAVVEGTARKGWKLSIGGELYSDAMGPTGTYAGTYIGMIDHNATLIARALGGEAPEKGLNGRLGE